MVCPASPAYGVLERDQRTRVGDLVNAGAAAWPPCDLEFLRLLRASSSLGLLFCTPSHLPG